MAIGIAQSVPVPKKIKKKPFRYSKNSVKVVLKSSKTDSSSSSSLPTYNNDLENQQQCIGVSTNDHSSSISEYWQCILNILSHGMLLIAILADAFSISIYYSTTLAGHFPINFWPHVAAISCYTFFKFILVVSTFIWFVDFRFMICSCVYDDYEKPSKQNFTRKNSSLKGTSLGIFSLIIVLLCLLFAGFGFGDEGIWSLTWNRKNNDDANDALIFTFELKPLEIPSSCRVYPWDESLVSYWISATMKKRQLNLEETKEFLVRHHCEVTIPTNEVSFNSNFGQFETYTVSIPNCSPP